MISTNHVDNNANPSTYPPTNYPNQPTHERLDNTSPQFNNNNNTSNTLSDNYTPCNKSTHESIYINVDDEPQSKTEESEKPKELFSEPEDDNVDVNGDDTARSDCDVSFDSSDEDVDDDDDDDDDNERSSSRLEIHIDEDPEPASGNQEPCSNDLQNQGRQLSPNKQRDHEGNNDFCREDNPSSLPRPSPSSSPPKPSNLSPHSLSISSSSSSSSSLTHPIISPSHCPVTTSSLSSPSSSTSSPSSSTLSPSSSTPPTVPTASLSFPNTSLSSSLSSDFNTPLPPSSLASSSSIPLSTSSSSPPSSLQSPLSSSTTMSVSSLPPAMGVVSLPNIKSEHIWVPPTLTPHPHSDKQHIPLVYPHPHAPPPSIPNFPDTALLKIKSVENSNERNSINVSQENILNKEDSIPQTESSRESKHYQAGNSSRERSGIHSHGIKENSNLSGFTSILERCNSVKKESGADCKPVVSHESILSPVGEMCSRDKDLANEREREEQRQRQKAKEERNRKEREREREERREKEKREEREAAEVQQRRRSDAERRDREISRAQAESIARHDVPSSSSALAMTLDPLGRPQGGVSEAAFSDYMRVLAASHGHSFLPPSPAAGLVHPMLQLRPQDPRFTSTPLLNHLGASHLTSPIGYFPKEQLIYPGTAGSSFLPPGFPAPSMNQIHPLLHRPPYAPAAAQPSLLEYQRSLAAAAAYGWSPGYPYLLSDLAGAASASSSSAAAAAAATSAGMKRPSSEFEVAVELNAKRMRLESCRPPDLGAQWDYFAAAAAAQRPPTSSLPCGLESSSMDKISAEALRKRYMEYMPQAAAYLSALPADYARPTVYQCACAEHRDDDIRLWQVEDVCKFLSNLDGCAVYTDHFREQRVDGRILALLSTDHLTKTLGMKLGPAVLLYEAVAKKLQDLSKMQNCEACRSIAMSQAVPSMPLQL